MGKSLDDRIEERNTIADEQLSSGDYSAEEVIAKIINDWTFAEDDHEAENKRLREAFEEVMEWAENWNPPFSEWPEVKDKALTVLKESAND